MSRGVAFDVFARRELDSAAGTMVDVAMVNAGSPPNDSGCHHGLRFMPSNEPECVGQKTTSTARSDMTGRTSANFASTFIRDAAHLDVDLGKRRLVLIDDLLPLFKQAIVPLAFDPPPRRVQNFEIFQAKVHNGSGTSQQPSVFFSYIPPFSALPSQRRQTVMSR